jgi:hypothetical protein
MVGRIDGGPIGDQTLGDVVVAPGVLAIAVGEQDDVARALVLPGVDDEAPALEL